MRKILQQKSQVVLTQAQYQPIPFEILIRQVVERHLTDPGMAFVLTGDGGQGKTLFCHALVIALLERQPDVVPIYIDIAENQTLDQVLSAFASADKKNLFFIFDGYGENGSFQNISVQYPVSYPHCSYLVTCRTLLLNQTRDISTLFAPTQARQVFRSQLQEYALPANPEYSLAAKIQQELRLSNTEQRSLSFFERWFQLQATKSLLKNHPGCVEDSMRDCHRLAIKMASLSTDEIIQLPESRLFPSATPVINFFSDHSVYRKWLRSGFPLVATKKYSYRWWDAETFQFFKNHQVIERANTTAAQQAHANLPLHIASAEGNIDEINRLHQADPQLIHRVDRKLRTALHVAVKNQQLSVVVLLLTLGVDKNGQDYKGRTALHYAAEFDETTDIVEVLLQAGVDIALNDNKGKNMLHRAASRGNTRVLAYILETEGRSGTISVNKAKIDQRNNIACSAC